MKTPAPLVAIVAAALALCGSFAPIVAKAQAAPDPTGCVEHKTLNTSYAEPDGYRYEQVIHAFYNTCNYDIFFTAILEAGRHTGGDDFRSRIEPSFLCPRGQDDKWISPLGERKGHYSSGLRDEFGIHLNRFEYIPLAPIKAYDIDMLNGIENLSPSDQRQIWSEFLHGGGGIDGRPGVRELLVLGVSPRFCPERRTRVRWCLEWADEERQKQFEKENNLRGGCREYNQPNWSDAAAKNAAVSN